MSLTSYEKFCHSVCGRIRRVPSAMPFFWAEQFTELSSPLVASLVIVYAAPLVGFNAGILGIPVPSYIGTLGEWAVNYVLFASQDS